MQISPPLQENTLSPNVFDNLLRRDMLCLLRAVIFYTQDGVVLELPACKAFEWVNMCFLKQRGTVGEWLSHPMLENYSQITRNRPIFMQPKNR